VKPSKYTFILVVFFLLISNTAYLLAQKIAPDTGFREAKHGVYVIAHRGAHIGIPENSLAAYQKAIDLGCDFVEIDVRTTKDGGFVSIHNSSVEEYADGIKGKVSELTLAELKSLDIGFRIGAQWKGTRIPAFEEILKLCQGKIGIYLDLKAASVSALVEIIKKYRMENDILWYLTADRMQEIREIVTNCPECIPMPDPGPASNIDLLMDKIHVHALATDMGELSEQFVSTAHQYHARVTVDENEGNEDEWSKIIDWKTDGIQTDRPEALITFLKKRKR